MYFAKRTHFRLRLRDGETVFAVTKAASEDWRRGRDSNPRDAYAPNGFQDRRIRPLCHLSIKYLGKHTLACWRFAAIISRHAQNQSQNRDEPRKASIQDRVHRSRW